MTKRTSKRAGPMDRGPAKDRQIGAARRGLVLLGGIVGGLAIVVWLLAGPLHVQPFAGWFGGGDATEHASHDSVSMYTCPMHPDVLQKGPGSCPICKMDLVPVKQDGGEASMTGAADSASAGQTLWTCGMHPDVIQKEPGTCPICHMDLTPMQADSEATDEGDTPAGHQGATVRIDPAVVQNMNVLTEPVRIQNIERHIRTVGYLSYDQERMVSVTTKYSGWLEKVHVNYIGQPVRKGEPLFEVYSPELVQTAQELLSAQSYVQQMQKAPDDARQRAEALLAAARSRLAFWDIDPLQILQLAGNDQTVRTLTVVAPASGVVMKRLDGLEGRAVKPGMELFHIADLSELWLTVEVFENQFQWVHEGSHASIQLTYFPGESFEGIVRFIEPEVSEKTRTVRLRLQVPNPDARLRVGMFATVKFEPVVVRDALTVPSQALLRTGERDLVVVAIGSGRFAPRQVVVGTEGEGVAQILSGLEPGEEIVTSAQFLIDSESNLRAAIQKLLAGHAH